jgi:hypothetical protein
MLPAGEIRIYLACGVTDMRKGFHSLAAQVQTVLQHDPYCGAIFLFRGRRGNQPTFCIRSTFCEDRVSVSSLLWAGSSSFSEQARSRSSMCLHG